ncbi:type II toxin-antitoxin system RelE/ParE family toxin [Embleya sp. NPDC050154]|uniref:type II toxin-antitoxin system RelE/ParE family toxin n=1 Tax=unclassified Embleya TaxID=2699296 RepID=UPI00378EA42F
MSFRVRYAKDAQADVHDLASEPRRRFDTELARLAGDPFGRESIALGERDYRQVRLGGCIATYHADEDARIVSVVRVMGPQ